MTWLLNRGEAKNVFTKVFRLVSAEVSIYTVFFQIIVYTAYRISLYVTVYIEKKQDIRSTTAPVRKV